MKMKWSETQYRRLKELNADANTLSMCFDSNAERDQTFQKTTNGLIQLSRHQLKAWRDDNHRPQLCLLEEKLSGALSKAGFVQVNTPIIMSVSHLEKMLIDTQHPLYSQVFWIDARHCLRPMLAPHLYYILKDLLRLWERPIRLFEVGPCFRKDTQGAVHANEFTMLNLVEMGSPEGERHARLEALGNFIMTSAGIDNYRFVMESSEVYGDTLDIVAGPERIEVASGAMGPHVLDRAWQITESWVGIGFGLERLLMVSKGSDSVSKMGRSLSYMDGIRLNIQ